MGVIRLKGRRETWSGPGATLETMPPTLGAVFGALAEPAVPPSARRASCPGCTAVYALAADGLPPWGARVTCGECGASFPVGARADATTAVRLLAERNADAWRSACRTGTLWEEFGEALFACYEELRDRYGTAVAVRAFRPAVEEVAPGAPWYGPNSGTAVTAAMTMFDRRRVE